ncbi:calcium-binding protein [Sphingomonas sp. AX6]|uniref:calcium-binding protein n=1 Tax=Sphingomonas sp. AX6 TaxID=2653171 RepID=UPI0012F296BE|nr:calcium-binding protein [Sphingomonas sp. AX6]VXC61412.1 hypothetical protein SPHINGOAX6_30127 [Sphingomonas sp. AX6]
MAVINGTEGADTLIGTSADDVFSAGGGNDLLISGGGFDTMAGGMGDDTYQVDGQVVIDERGDIFEERYGFDTVLVSGDRFELFTFGVYRSEMAIEVLRASDPDRTTGITLIGNSFSQDITGGNGDDLLDTGLPANTFDISSSPARPETLMGLGGNDHYIVRGSTTKVIEAVGGGYDTITINTNRQVAGGSYELSADAEIEEIRISGGLRIDIVGNRFDQLIVGNDDGSVLIGGGGDDTLVGLLGNDTYLVDSASDVVIERVDGGTDIIYTTTSYNLGDNSIEVLSTVDHSATVTINLIGNFVAQTIIGNYGDNVLNGGSGGLDTLIGLFGNDIYAVGDSATVIQEQDGQGFDTVVTSVDYSLAAGVSVELLAAQDRSSTIGLRLSGNVFAQTIAGTEGADTIAGGGGMDTLFGGGGADLFVMSGTAAGNVAVIGDFNAGGQADRIGLSTGFEALGASLDTNEFLRGTAAAGTNAQVIYDQVSGQLFYDADGTGTGAAVLFATVAPGSALETTSFTMLAAATPSV